MSLSSISTIVTVGFELPSEEVILREREEELIKEERLLTLSSSRIYEPREPSPAHESPALSDINGQADGVKLSDGLYQNSDSTTPSGLPPRSLSSLAFGRTLGTGAFGEVKLATDLNTDEEFAVKIINKSKVNSSSKTKYIISEKDILNLVKHPNIILLYDTLQDDENCYFILEYCKNGELFDHLKKAGRFSEPVTRFYAAEIINAIECLHLNGIIHRDLKPENVLLDANMHVKLSDFGTAKNIGANEKVEGSTFTGTADYVSPELLRNKTAGKASDLWSLGCIIYQMLYGKPPFKATTDFQTFELILNHEYAFPEDIHVTVRAKDLIEHLLDPNEATRLDINSFAALKMHPFFEKIDWKEIRNETPPTIEPLRMPSTPSTPSGTLGASRDSPMASRGLTPLRGSKSNSISSSSIPESLSESQEIRNKINRSKSEASSKARKSLLEYTAAFQFLFTNERIVHSNMVLKKGKIFSRKRQLILTSGPRLIYLDPEKLELRGEIPLKDLVVEIKSNRKFVFTIPGKSYLFEDLTNEAQKWEEYISRSQLYLEPQSPRKR